MLRCVFCGLLSLLMFACFSARGESRFEVTPVLGAALFDLNIANNGSVVNSKAGGGVAGGAFIAYAFNPFISLETGILGVRRHVNDTAGVGSSASATYLEAPLLVRWRPMSFVSFALGGYGAMAISDLETVSSARVTTTTAFDNTNFRGTDLGAMASVRAHVPMTDRITFILDVRGMWGIADISTIQATTTRYRGAEFLGGLSFGL